MTSRILSRALMAALGLAMVMTSSLASASEPQRLGAGYLLRAMSDCSADRERFCANVPSGGGRIVRCLMDNRERLTPACRPHIERAATIGNAWSSCRSDVERFCYNVMPGGGRVVACLNGNRDRLTPACRRGMDDARAALR